MNGPPELPTDTIPMPVPEPAVPLPPVRVPVADEPPAEPAVEAGPVVGTPAPQPRWVGEAVRDLFAVSRKKLVVLTTAGSVVAVGLALNAMFTGAGLAPPEAPSSEHPAEPKALAAAPAEPPAPETRQSSAAAIPPEPQTVVPIAIATVQPPDLRTPQPAAAPTTDGVSAPSIPVVPAPAVGGSEEIVTPSPIVPVAHTEPAPVTPAPKLPADDKPTTPAPPGGVSPPAGLPAPTLPIPPAADPMPTPAKPEPKSDAPAAAKTLDVAPVARTPDILPPGFKPLDVAPPTVPAADAASPAAGGAAKPSDKQDGPAARLELKGFPPDTPLPEEKKPAEPKPEEKKDAALILSPPVPRPAEGPAVPPPTLPAGGVETGTDRTTPPAAGSPAPTTAGPVTAPGDLPIKPATPVDSGQLPQPKDAVPVPPAPFKSVPAGDDRPAGGTLNLTKPAGGAGARPAAGQEAPKTDFDVDLHKPKAGDTYESISKLYYRDTRYAEALRQFNRNVELDRGFDVQVPPMYVLRQQFPQLIRVPRSSPGTPEWAPSAGRERK